MNVRIFKCLIGSPGDTTKERQYCKEVFCEINKTIGEKFKFRVESLMWEDDSRPSFGDDSQEVINRQLLLKEYNIFIGILWARFGTPTLRAESGTIEEFEDAYKKYNDKNELEICVYFNKQDIPQEKINIEQISKVFQFKDKVSSLGGLYHEYNGADNFKEKLRTHLTKYFLEIFDSLNNMESKNNENVENSRNDLIETSLKEKFSDSLSLFKDHNPCWIEPILSRTNQISTKYSENFKNRVNLNEIIGSPQSIIIKSPPQFGLTCLSHYFILQAWRNRNIWIYLDSTKINRNNVEKEVLKVLKSDFYTNDTSLIKCIIVDSWKNTLIGGMKILKNLSNSFKSIPMIVMQTIDPNNFLQEPPSENIDREFQCMYLLALPKTEIRKLVNSYNDYTYIADEDKVLNKVISDLDTLNIHRTPMNCLTLLKVSEKYFDEKTINRSNMLEKVLFILFDLKEIPTYKTKPDLKDCEFVLGIFCEQILRNEKYEFTKNDFISFSQSICNKNYIDLDIHLLFDILYLNGIFVDDTEEFSFRASYWLFYFAATRMHANSEFCNYIFSTGKYVNYPEIIEFYTGIDRRRTDALEILKKDIDQTSHEVLNKLGLPNHIDPYIKIEWNPSPASIEKAREEISENVQASKLPVQIKDQHSDASKNQLRPYNQGIRTILNEYSLAILMRKITASSRALRNSDYAQPMVKKELLESIFTAYEQVAKAIMILTPELAVNGRAAFGGQSFNLEGDFGDTVEKRLNMILQQIPGNVVRFFKDDINSEKIGPLLIDRYSNEKIPLNKHVLILLLIHIRPLNWRATVESYIKSLPKNSYYLFDLMGQSRHLYFYDYITEKEIGEFKQLLLAGYSKNEFGGSKPSKNILNQFAQSIFKKPKTDSNN